MVFTSLYPDPPAVADMNLHNFCFNRPDQAAWPDYTCLADTNGLSYSVQQFTHRALQGATALSAELGLHPGCGEVVGIMSVNTLDYITLVHSCLALTVPFIGFSHQSTKFELRHLWLSSNATRIFVAPNILSLALDVAKELGIGKDRVHILGGTGIPGHSSFEGLLQRIQGQPLITAAPATKSTLAYLVNSSGTSGLPKCIKITHHNVIYNLLQTTIANVENAKITGPREWDTPEKVPVLIAFLPLSHSVALNLCCFRAFLAPSTCVIIPKWDPIAVIQAIPKYRVTHIPLVPSLAASMVSNPEMLHGVDLSSLDTVITGAAHMPPEIANKLSKLLGKSVKFSEGYGMSETTFTAIFTTVDGILNGKVRNAPGSVGILIPGMKARILDEDGAEVGLGETGELWLKGDNIAEGYFNNPDANKGTFVDGWLRTGDRFYVDEDGNFFFVDRIKDTLKISGIQVSPLEIEDVLLAHPKKLIAEVAVAGVSGGRTSDERLPRAWIVLSHEGKIVGDQQAIKELRGWVERNLSKHKWLRGGFQIVDQLPKSLNGKVLKRVLQEQYEKTNAQVKL